MLNVRICFGLGVHRLTFNKQTKRKQMCVKVNLGISNKQTRSLSQSHTRIRTNTTHYTPFAVIAGAKLALVSFTTHNATVSEILFLIYILYIPFDFLCMVWRCWCAWLCVYEMGLCVVLYGVYTFKCHFLRKFYSHHMGAGTMNIFGVLSRHTPCNVCT